MNGSVPPSASRSAAERDVIVFDGVCRLCTGSVRFVAARDDGARFSFAPFQSAAAGTLLGRIAPGIDPQDGIVLVTRGGAVLTGADAALAIASGLRFPWPAAAAIARLAPRGLRDAIYRLVARRRYRWFGRRDACFVPDASLRGRFMEDAAAGVRTDDERQT